MKIYDKVLSREFARGNQAIQISKNPGIIAASLLLMATAAHAQSTAVPQVYSTSTGGSASTTITGLPTETNGDATLDDYVSSASGNFNDRVMVITRAELMRKVEKR